jgi:hypothetical protein
LVHSKSTTLSLEEISVSINFRANIFIDGSALEAAARTVPALRPQAQDLAHKFESAVLDTLNHIHDGPRTMTPKPMVGRIVIDAIERLLFDDSQ